MEPLGSPQGAHDAAAHLFGVPHRVEHVDSATAAALKVVCRLLCASSLLLQAAGWQRWCWLENRRWEGASLHLGSPHPTPPPRLLPLRHKQGGCRGADGGDREMSRTAVVLFLSAGINARHGAGVTGGENAEPLGGD